MTCSLKSVVVIFHNLWMIDMGEFLEAPGSAVTAVET